ncbi:MAG TPA: hypothetical protein VJN18_27235 [Polyangiaceae bacterium]|nr:hypothetical protein [Polyangiaceae bacterium]
MSPPPMTMGVLWRRFSGSLGVVAAAGAAGARVSVADVGAASVVAGAGALADAGAVPGAGVIGAAVGAAGGTAGATSVQ